MPPRSSAATKASQSCTRVVVQWMFPASRVEMDERGIVGIIFQMQDV
jgi:hypothetical protein